MEQVLTSREGLTVDAVRKFYTGVSGMTPPDKIKFFNSLDEARNAMILEGVSRSEVDCHFFSTKPFFMETLILRNKQDTLCGEQLQKLKDFCFIMENLQSGFFTENSAFIIRTLPE